MSEPMETSKTPTVNLLEFADSAFTEEVNIDIEGKPSNKFSCSLCVFQNADRGGMKRHIHARHKPGGIKRMEHDVTNDDIDAKKSKFEEFNPNSTSTQKPTLDITIPQGYSNESLLNFLDDKYEFKNNVDETLDETVKDGQDDEMKAAVEDAVMIADLSLMSRKISKLEEELKLKVLESTENYATIESLENENFVLKEDVVKFKDDMKTKDTLNESNLGMINSLEEKLKKKTTRLEIVEPAVTKLMHDMKVLKAGNAGNEATYDKVDDQEMKKLKRELKEKTDDKTFEWSQK
jgi:hypothetical protein